MVLPIAGDSLPENNQRLDYLFPVINSLDPNQKSVYPAGACYQHYVLNQAPLTYTIQFQNTGNAEP
ncbi:MAG: hypothetical protein U0176_04865 [Bacteroidia bacterium]